MNRSVDYAVSIFIALLAVTLTGCGGGSGTTAVTARRFGSLEYTLTTTKTTFAHGEQVPLTFTVRNVGSQTINVILGACEPFDTKVTSGSAVVWQDSLTHGCGTEVTFIAIAPGETKTYTYTWPQADQQGNQIPAGSYTLTSWYQAYSVTDATLSSGNQEVNEWAYPLHIVLL